MNWFIKVIFCDELSLPSYKNNEKRDEWLWKGASRLQVFRR